MKKTIFLLIGMVLFSSLSFAAIAEREIVAEGKNSRHENGARHPSEGDDIFESAARRRGEYA